MDWSHCAWAKAPVISLSSGPWLLYVSSCSACTRENIYFAMSALDDGAFSPHSDVCQVHLWVVTVNRKDSKNRSASAYAVAGSADPRFGQRRLCASGYVPKSP